MAKTYLSSTDQFVSFTSLHNGTRTQHDIVGWVVSDKDEATPILFPTPKKGAHILYSRGMQSACWNQATGEVYSSMDLATEVLK